MKRRCREWENYFTAPLRFERFPTSFSCKSFQRSRSRRDVWRGWIWNYFRGPNNTNQTLRFLHRNSPLFPANIMCSIIRFSVLSAHFRLLFLCYPSQSNSNQYLNSVLSLSLILSAQTLKLKHFYTFYLLFGLDWFAKQSPYEPEHGWSVVWSAPYGCRPMTIRSLWG